jgi:hypothetical protein
MFFMKIINIIEYNLVNLYLTFVKIFISFFSIPEKNHIYIQL